jgi:hypothetical protein
MKIPLLKRKKSRRAPKIADLDMFYIAIGFVLIGFIADTFQTDRLCSDRFQTDTFHTDMFCLGTRYPIPV